MAASPFHRLFTGQVLRHLRAHPLPALANVAGIALGVAVYLSVQISNRSASASFSAAVDVVAGRADLVVQGSLPESLLRSVADLQGVAAATPRFETLLALPEHPGEYLHLVGLDPFTNEPFSTFRMVDAQEGFDIERWLGDPSAIGIARPFAERHGLRHGDTLPVLLNGRRHAMRIAYILDPDNAAAERDTALQRHASMDVGNALALAGPPHRLSSILVKVGKGVPPEDVATRIRSLPGADISVATPQSRSRQVDRMLSSFRLNLTAMSLVSLLVGMFLVYNAVTASVVRRRREIGMLRALGAERKLVARLFIAEAACYGLAGCALGVPLGILASTRMVDGVAGAISSQYVLVAIEGVSVAPPDVAAAVAAGMASALLAAWKPAADAARMHPAVAIGRAAQSASTSRRAHAPATLLGLASLCASALVSWLAVATGPAWLGFAGAFLALLGFALWSPIAIDMYCATLARWRPFGGRTVLPGLSLLSMSRDNTRHAINIGALTAAIAMLAGVSTMIHSFRQSVDAWIGDVMQADVFVTPAENSIPGNDGLLPDEVVDFAVDSPLSRRIDTYRPWKATMDGNTPVTLGVVLGDPEKKFRFPGQNAGLARHAFLDDGDLLASEPLAARHGIEPGDMVTLTTPMGETPFRIAGVYRDYSSDRGVLLMKRRVFERYWDAPRVQSLAVYLADGATTDAFRKTLEERFGTRYQLAVYSNASLRKRVFEIFDQTFAVTQVLRMIAVAVAVLGIFLTLTTLAMERTRQTGVLRAIGGSRRQIRDLFILEGLHTGLLASLLGIAAGVCLSLILTFSINKAFFGWSIELDIPWLWLAAIPFWFLAASLVAACLPAIRAARQPIAPSLRYE